MKKLQADKQGLSVKRLHNCGERTKRRNIDVVTHCILGLPGETKEDMLQTIDYVADTNTQGIKLHLLHLMKDTPMMKLYEEGKLRFMGKDEYVDLVVDCIETSDKHGYTQAYR